MAKPCNRRVGLVEDRGMRGSHREACVAQSVLPSALSSTEKVPQKCRGVNAFKALPCVALYLPELGVTEFRSVPSGSGRTLLLHKTDDLAQQLGSVWSTAARCAKGPTSSIVWQVCATHCTPPLLSTALTPGLLPWTA